MASTQFAEPTVSRSRSRTSIEITEVWNWGWAEHVRLTNTGDQPANIGGWVLAAFKEKRVFRFPAGYTLQPGATVTIHSGSNATLKQNPPTDLYWDSEPIWANRGDMALLFDAAGNEQARYVYTMRGEPDLDAEPEKRLVEDEFGFQIADA